MVAAVVVAAVVVAAVVVAAVVVAVPRLGPVPCGAAGRSARKVSCGRVTDQGRVDSGQAAAVDRDRPAECDALTTEQVQQRIGP
jgi:hypothetical protein